MRAKPGFKFVVTLKLPNGIQMAIGTQDGKLALVPITKTGVVRGALAWDTTEHVEKFLKDFEAKHGEEIMSKLKALNMDIGQIEIAH